MFKIGTVGRFAILGFVAMVLVVTIVARQVSERIEKDAVTEAVEDVKGTLIGRIVHHIEPADMVNPPVGEHYEKVHSYIQESLISGRVVRIKVWNKEGRIVYSHRQELVGQQFPLEESLEEALRGEVVADVSSLQSKENIAEKGEYEKLLEVYVPIRFDGSSEVVGAYEAYYRWDQVAQHVAETRRTVLSWLGLGLVLLYVVALVMLNGAASTITRLLRQSEQRATELESVYKDLRQTHLSTLEALAAAVEARDPYTFGHVHRVREYSLAIAKELGYGDEAALETLGRAAILHDIGKIGVADAILRKPGKLEPSEMAEMRKHPGLGWQLLKRVSFLKDELDLIRHHHERCDGTGYPDGLKGEEIPLGASIIQVADVVDAMTSDRPYRRALPIEVVRAELQREAGAAFRPTVVKAMLKIIDAGLVPDAVPVGAQPGVN